MKRTIPEHFRSSKVFFQEMDPEARMASEATMDVDDADNKDSTNRGQSDGADVLALPRNRLLRANLHTFTQRYCLLLSTFAMAVKEVAASANIVWVAKPLFTFNPAHLGQYTTPQDLTWLISQGTNGAAVLVNKLSGSLKFVGLNSPFVTQSADQASTNSSVTLLGMTGVGLERVSALYQGQATIADTTATLEGWAQDTVNGGYDWQSKQTPTAVADISATTWTKTMDGADSNFVDYTCTSSLKCSKSTRDATDYPNLGKCMKPIDLTSSQGEIAGWKHKMSNCAIAIPNIATQLQLASNTRVSCGKDHLIALPSSDGNAALALRSATTSTPSVTKHMYLSHNNVYRLGMQGDCPQVLPPKTYVQLIPPPTVSATTTQDIFLQVILDVEMDVLIERDSMYNTANVFSDKSSYVAKSSFLGDSQSSFNGNPASSGTL